jgi:hypothetical protein
MAKNTNVLIASSLRITSHTHGSGNGNKDFVPPPRNCGSTKALQSSIDGPGGQSKLTSSISDNCFKVPGTRIHRIELVSLNKFGLVVEQVGIIVKVSACTVSSVVGTPRELSITNKQGNENKEWQVLGILAVKAMDNLTDLSKL